MYTKRTSLKVISFPLMFITLGILIAVSSIHCQPTPEQAPRNIYWYSTSLDNFSLVGRTVHSRINFPAFAIDNSIHAIGGSYKHRTEDDKSIEVFDINTNTSHIQVPDYTVNLAFPRFFGVEYEIDNAIRIVNINDLNHCCPR